MQACSSLRACGKKVCCGASPVRAVNHGRVERTLAGDAGTGIAACLPRNTGRSNRRSNAPTEGLACDWLPLTTIYDRPSSFTRGLNANLRVHSSHGAVPELGLGLYLSRIGILLLAWVRLMFIPGLQKSLLSITISGISAAASRKNTHTHRLMGTLGALVLPPPLQRELVRDMLPC